MNGRWIWKSIVNYRFTEVFGENMFGWEFHLKSQIASFFVLFGEINVNEIHVALLFAASVLWLK